MPGCLNDLDRDVAPKERGRVDAGRGARLEDCPYSTPQAIADWQDGWRHRNAMIRLLHEESEKGLRRLWC